MSKFTIEGLRNDQKLRLALYELMLIDWEKPIEECHKNDTYLGFCHYLSEAFDFSIYDFDFYKMLPELYNQRKTRNDEIENPLPIFYHEDGEIIETFTEAYGYPNVTVDGMLIYDNTFFKTKKECVIDAIKEMEYSVKSTNIQIKESEKKLAILRDRFYLEKSKLIQLRTLKKIYELGELD